MEKEKYLYDKKQITEFVDDIESKIYDLYMEWNVLSMLLYGFCHEDSDKKMENDALTGLSLLMARLSGGLNDLYYHVLEHKDDVGLGTQISP